MDFSIRAIDSAALPGIRATCQTFFAEAKYPGSFAVGEFEDFWGPLIDTGHGMILTAERLNTLAGVLGVTFSPCLFNGTPKVTYIFRYVRPEFRRQGLGAQMCDRVEYIARHRQATAILAGHILTINRTGCREYYESNGYVLRELVFRKELV